MMQKGIDEQGLEVTAIQSLKACTRGGFFFFF